MKILLKGFYGGRNVGDDALLYVSLRELDRLWPGARVGVCPDLGSALPETSLATYKVPMGRRNFYRAILRHTMLLYGGGGIMQAYTDADTGLPAMASYGRFARRLRRPVCYIGVSVGPLLGARAADHVRRMIGDATLVTVRDRASLRILEEIGASGNVHVTGDLALLLVDEHWRPPASYRPPSRVLGVSVKAFLPASAGGDEALENARLEAIAGALDKLMGENPELVIKLLCLHRGERSDLEVAQRLRETLDAPRRAMLFPYASDPRETLAEIASCDWLLAWRLHAAILAYVVDTPMLMLDYHPKTNGFAEMIGLPHDAMLPAAGLRADALAERLRTLIAGELPRATVPRAQSVADAWRNFELLEQAVGRR